jgi:hypothetical protein
VRFQNRTQSSHFVHLCYDVSAARQEEIIYAVLFWHRLRVGRQNKQHSALGYVTGRISNVQRHVFDMVCHLSLQVHRTDDAEIAWKQVPLGIPIDHEILHELLARLGIHPVEEEQLMLLEPFEFFVQLPHSEEYESLYRVVCSFDRNASIESTILFSFCERSILLI